MTINSTHTPPLHPFFSRPPPCTGLIVEEQAIAGNGGETWVGLATDIFHLLPLMGSAACSLSCYRILLAASKSVRSVDFWHAVSESHPFIRIAYGRRRRQVEGFRYGAMFCSVVLLTGGLPTVVILPKAISRYRPYSIRRMERFFLVRYFLQRS